MALTLDTPRAVGDLLVVALCDARVDRHPLPGGAGFFARKHPVAILMRRGARITAFAPDGEVLDLNTLERRFPGLQSRLEKVSG